MSLRASDASPLQVSFFEQPHRHSPVHTVQTSVQGTVRARIATSHTSLPTLPMCRYLHGNNVSGTIPNTFYVGRQNALLALYVANRELIEKCLTDGVAIHRDIGANQLSGPLPSSLLQFSRLSFLCAPRFSFACWQNCADNPLSSRNLGSNRLSGTLPTGIGSLTRLHKLCVPARPLDDCRRTLRDARFPATASSTTTNSPAAFRPVWENSRD